MGHSLPDQSRLDRLNSVDKPTPARSKLPLNDVERGAQLLRRAIARTGMTHDEVIEALGVHDKGHATRLIDGTHAERLWVHCMLRRKAYPILRELFILVMLEAGDGDVERVVRIRESA